MEYGFTRKEYSAGAVKHLFWFMEFRKVVQLLSGGMSMAEIRDLNQNANLFGCPSGKRSRQILQTVSARISCLDESFLPVFMQGDLSTQKLLALIAAMAYDTLFFDLVYEVVREQFILGTGELKDNDIRAFFHRKQQQSEKAAGWTDATIGNLATSYKSMLYEAGLVNKAKGTRKLFRPILSRELEDWLAQHGLAVMTAALTGV